ncbi:MAG: hypothetical protein K6C13_05870 [Oscillospiraceae bacterium]|nr:hypothetical protein [Oscillospiraceae bacterium]
MYIVNEESYERVSTAVDEIREACEVGDDYMEWEDVAASAIEPVFDELDEEQLRMTVSAFIEYINDTADEDRNMALGVKAALIRCLKEKADYMDTYVEYHEDSWDDEEVEKEEPQENPYIDVLREQVGRVQKVTIN